MLFSGLGHENYIWEGEGGGGQAYFRTFAHDSSYCFLNQQISRSDFFVVVQLVISSLFETWLQKKKNNQKTFA